MPQINEEMFQAVDPEEGRKRPAFTVQGKSAPIKVRISVPSPSPSLRASKSLSSKWGGSRFISLDEQLILEVIEFNRATLSLECNFYFFDGKAKSLNFHGANDLLPDPIFLNIKHQSLARNQPALTKRELDVLRISGEGFSAKEVAKHLSISPFTVCDHFKSIYVKLQVNNRTRAVIVARELGML